MNGLEMIISGDKSLRSSSVPRRKANSARLFQTFISAFKISKTEEKSLICGS